jgi:hypothetical protein
MCQGTPEWEIFLYITQQRMMKELSLVNVMTNPTNDTRKQFLHHVLPPLKKIEQDRAERNIKKTLEWTSGGPIHVSPIGNVKPLRPTDPIF